MSNEKTSRKVASKAGKVLSDPNATADQKSVAASALNQAEDRAPLPTAQTAGFEFNPKYHKNKDGEVTGIEHLQARVVLQTKNADARKLKGQTVEIRGQTSDGRRLCVTESGQSAWLSVEDLEAATK